jgi:hypothetical protein
MPYAETTKVPLERSISEIIGMVRKAGGERVGQFDDGDRFHIWFRLGEREVRFTVPLVTSYDGPPKAANGVKIDPAAKIDQANRQKGRALMLVIKAKLESVQSGVETFEQAFLANIVMSNGQTVHERVAEPIALEYREGVSRPMLPPPCE